MVLEQITDQIALFFLATWPVFSFLYLTLTHAGIAYWRKLGKNSGFIPITITAIAFAVWAPWVYSNGQSILAYKTQLGEALQAIGGVIALAAAYLEIATARQLGFRIFFLQSEVKRETKRLVTTGFYSIVRHPNYWAHHLGAIGLFLLTQVTAFTWLFVADVVFTQLFIIPLEEKELRDRFGKTYESYSKRVPRFIPRF